MTNRLLLFLTVFVFFGCSGGGVSSGPVFDEEGYDIIDIRGSALQKAEKKDANGVVIKEGYLLNGVKTGAWITYHPDNQLPQTITNWVDGVASGLYLEMNDRGQVELRASYLNNKLDGAWGKYRFGRPTHLAEYKEGELHGVYKEFNTRDGKILKEIHYKNGKYDGPYLFYNDEGEVTVQYEYRNGEKVSGGIAEGGNAEEQ